MSAEQKKHLIEFVCNNYSRLFGQMEGPFGKNSQINLWNKLNDSLNKLGPTRTVQYWRKVCVPLRNVFLNHFDEKCVDLCKTLILFY